MVESPGVGPTNQALPKKRVLLIRSRCLKARPPRSSSRSPSRSRSHGFMRKVLSRQCRRRRRGGRVDGRESCTRVRRPPPPPLRASRRARSAVPSQRSSSARRVTPPSSAKRPPRPSALSCRRHAHSRRRGGLRRAGCRGRSLRTHRRLRCSSCRHRLMCAVIASSSVATHHSPLLLAATSSAQRRPGHGRCCAEEAATRRRHCTPPPHGQCAAIGCDQQLASLRAGGLGDPPCQLGGGGDRKVAMIK